MKRYFTTSSLLVNKLKNFNEGYNSYDEWLKQFPLWSSTTLRRIINKLEKQGLLIKRNYNKLKIDQTK